MCVGAASMFTARAVVCRRSLRTYIRRVYAAQKLLLHLAVNRDFVSLAYGAAKCFLRDMRSIQISAEATPITIGGQGFPPASFTVSSTSP